MGETETNKKIGMLLKDARRIMNLGQEEIAEKVGRSKKQISNYETGFSRIPGDVMFKLLSILEDGLTKIGTYEQFANRVVSKMKEQDNPLELPFSLNNGYFLFSYTKNTFLCFKKNSILIVRTFIKTEQVIMGEIYIVERNGTKEVCRLQILGNTIKIIYDNTDFDSIKVPVSEINILGKVMFEIIKI